MNTAQITAIATQATIAILNETHAVYNTEAYKADGIDPTEQARFETEERGDELVADVLREEHGIDVWEDDDAYEAMVDAVAAACEAWTA